MRAADAGAVSRAVFEPGRLIGMDALEVRDALVVNPAGISALPVEVIFVVIVAVDVVHVVGVEAELVGGVVAEVDGVCGARGG